MKMMAHRLYAPKDMRFMEVDVPELAPDEVRIKVKCCGICGTDYSIYSGEASFWEDGLIKTPMTFGHEYSGVIDAVGCNVTDFKVGDRVVSDTAIGCGKCPACMSGHYMKCTKMLSVGTVNCKDGGYAEYTTMPEKHVFHLPDNVSFEQGALCEPISTAMYCCFRAGIKIGETVLIMGTGPIGLGAIQPAKYLGASLIAVAGRKPLKLEAAKKLGADVVIDLTKEDLVEAMMKLTNGEGFDRIIEATGSHEMLRTAVNTVKGGGGIGAVAFYDTKLNDLNIDRLVLNDVTLAGSAGSENVGRITLSLMKSGRIDGTPMITHRIKLEEAKDFLDNMKKNSANTIKGLIVFD